MACHTQVLQSIRSHHWHTVVIFIVFTSSKSKQSANTGSSDTSSSSDLDVALEMESSSLSPLELSDEISDSITSSDLRLYIFLDRGFSIDSHVVLDIDTKDFVDS